MKQMTEAQLRKLLEEAWWGGYEEASWLHTPSDSPETLLEHEQDSRNETVNELMESV